MERPAAQAAGAVAEVAQLSLAAGRWRGHVHTAKFVLTNEVLRRGNLGYEVYF